LESIAGLLTVLILRFLRHKEVGDPRRERERKMGCQWVGIVKVYRQFTD
jgi:hypothetical protein